MMGVGYWCYYYYYWYVYIYKSIDISEQKKDDDYLIAILVNAVWPTAEVIQMVMMGVLKDG